MDIITTYSAVQKQKRRDALLEKIRLIQESLSEQKAAWSNFSEQTAALSDDLHGLSGQMGETWHDEHAMAERIARNKDLIQQMEQALAQGDMLLLQRLQKSMSA